MIIKDKVKEIIPALQQVIEALNTVNLVGYTNMKTQTNCIEAIVNISKALNDALSECENTQDPDKD